MHHATPENEKKIQEKDKGKKAQDGVESGSEQPVTGESSAVKCVYFSHPESSA